MNLEPIYAEYNRQWKLSREDYRNYSQAQVPYKSWPHVSMNYGQLEDMIRNEARLAYPEFSIDKLNYIWSKVYEDYHSSFSDCIGGMHNLCEFVKNMPN